MENKTYTYTDAKGNTVSIPVKVNKKLTQPKEKNKHAKSNKKSGLAKKIAAAALVISIGVGTLLGANALLKHLNNEPSKQPIAQEQVQKQEEQAPEQDYINEYDNENLRFNPNSEDFLVDKASFLIEDAAKSGKALDAEDAVLSVIVANSDEMTSGFYGKLFGERKDQTYTYSKLVDAYLRVGMMEVENMSIATNEDRTFNTEDIFANQEDYDYLLNIRNLVTKFNNSTDKSEKKEISEELNKIALDLCTYEAYDISSPAGVLAMLSLDGMRIQTITNNEYTVLPDDIRDEMFGNGDYGCHKEATFASEDGQVLPTHYSYRVNDLKLDAVKTKLDNAFLEEGQPIIERIIEEVKENTKDVVVADINIADEINKQAEANRDIPYAYETAPGKEKPNYSPIKEGDKIEKKPNGEKVVVVDRKKEDKKEEKTEEEARKELEEKQAQAQIEANKGAADGKHDGENGLAKRSTSGKSEYYVSAYNAAYNAYKEIYDAKKDEKKEEFIPVEKQPEKQTIEKEEEFIPLDGLSAEQLEELKKAAEGNEAIIVESGKIK